MGIMKCKIKKGDLVLVIQGKDRTRTGKVLKVFLAAHKVLVDGINLVKRHQRPRQQGKKGEIIEKPAAIDISNVKLVCGQCGKASRAGYRLAAEAKVRICKKCGNTI